MLAQVLQEALMLRQDKKACGAPLQEGDPQAKGSEQKRPIELESVDTQRDSKILLRVRTEKLRDRTGR